MMIQHCLRSNSFSNTDHVDKKLEQYRDKGYIMLARWTTSDIQNNFILSAYRPIDISKEDEEGLKDR